MKPIPDHLDKHLDIIFVGFNPSIRSSETGHHYANPTNRFWTILHKSGLTDKKLDPSEDARLLNYGYGLTNIVSRPTRNAEEITAEEYKQGREKLIEKIKHYQPKVTCFVGKGVYLQYSQRKQAPWGEQDEAVVPVTIDFAAPSSSGLVRMSMEEMVGIYAKLKKLIED